jgi:hypothetical protein
MVNRHGNGALYGDREKHCIINILKYCKYVFSKIIP